MKKMINFIASAKINYNIDSLDIYDSFDLVSTGKADAKLSGSADFEIMDNKFLFDIDKVEKIYTAMSSQTLETAKKINELRLENRAYIQKTQNLNGIIFSMHDLIKKEDFNSKKYDEAIKIARKSFIEGFFEDRLIESKHEIIGRMDKLLAEISKDKKRNILCIGHAFYLKILQAYIHDKNIINNKKGLIEFFQPDKKPFQSLDGFYCEL